MANQRNMKTIIIFFIVIIIIVLIAIKQIKLDREAKKGLQKINELGHNLVEADTSNLTLKEQEIYSVWNAEIKKEYDQIEASKEGWNQRVYDNLFHQAYPKIDALIMERYDLKQSDFDKIIDIGDVLGAKEISKKEIEISNRVVEIKKGDFQSQFQAAKEWEIPFYEVSQAMKKSTINVAINVLKE